MVITSTQKLTFEEYLNYQGESGVCYELYRGNLIEMPTPTAIHIKICEFLVYQFRRFFAAHNLALVAIVTTAVRTEENSSRIPDVVICTQRLWEQVCAQPGSAVLDFEEKPLLVIEVTSQNWRDDYIRKRAEYDLIDIPEYWIVDPTRPKIRVCSRPENETSYSHQEFLPGERVQSVQFAEFILSVNQVLAPPLVEDLIREEQARLQQLGQENLQLEQQNVQLEQQVNSERQRAERLAQRLREMGVDIDTEL
ncbi:MAG: Uma2 family endonuclease [Microcoleus sp. PH2017_10_PVI_O_A]|uniref:Uma2 family endonuclease n=1 Tax=unclassified Microcoleus TaxID=2642155 RepID=UPI001DA524E9|nr:MULTISPECIES: Uma2 family endonuclease [unclassified Microcoleus]TAE83305.1 MAG: Uma2 family endonuclease [Oscillatoriales cyanobacterium]MCC3405297.1 Uma2 family endonuclease [Microcoleus sp. PH2017_10_PVI_O_A]MCC3460420.1 Uma2 family endonuclease [Microcoleus sp. PH2017_11_PCY_U_A]MCC3478706.1 Uma2 family endonuclease [Microcoleus sp. PH2017_12_PCY_D_A]MCC3528377.1 Uma2 family endonuclease [Microcoleus sp. PH2017_21_RUC_O_A]